MFPRQLCIIYWVLVNFGNIMNEKFYSSHKYCRASLHRQTLFAIGESRLCYNGDNGERTPVSEYSLFVMSLPQVGGDGGPTSREATVAGELAFGIFRVTFRVIFA